MDCGNHCSNCSSSCSCRFMLTICRDNRMTANDKRKMANVRKSSMVNGFLNFIRQYGFYFVSVSPLEMYLNSMSARRTVSFMSQLRRPVLMIFSTQYLRKLTSFGSVMVKPPIVNPSPKPSISSASCSLSVIIVIFSANLRIFLFAVPKTIPIFAVPNQRSYSCPMSIRLDAQYEIGLFLCPSVCSPYL